MELFVVGEGLVEDGLKVFEQRFASCTFEHKRHGIRFVHETELSLRRLFVCRKKKPTPLHQYTVRIRDHARHPPDALSAHLLCPSSGAGFDPSGLEAFVACVHLTFLWDLMSLLCYLKTLDGGAEGADVDTLLFGCNDEVGCGAEDCVSRGDCGTAVGRGLCVGAVEDTIDETSGDVDFDVLGAIKGVVGYEEFAGGVGVVDVLPFLACEGKDVRVGRHMLGHNVVGKHVDSLLVVPAVVVSIVLLTKVLPQTPPSHHICNLNDSLLHRLHHARELLFVKLCHFFLELILFLKVVSCLDLRGATSTAMPSGRPTAPHAASAARTSIPYYLQTPSPKCNSLALCEWSNTTK